MAQSQYRKTGVSRKMDALGRIVIPMEIRREMKIQDGDAFEILIDPANHTLLLKDQEIVCDVCGKVGSLKDVPILDLKLCEACRSKLRTDLEQAEVDTDED